MAKQLAGMWEDKKERKLKVRITEFQKKGKRSPTFRLCTLDYLDYYPSGKKRLAKDREELKKKLYLEKVAELEAEREVKPLVIIKESDKHPLGDVIDEFVDTILIHKSLSTYKNVKQQLSYWKEYKVNDPNSIYSGVKFEDRPLSTFETESGILEIKNARNALSSKNRGDSTLNRYLAALSMVFGCAVKDFLYMKANPCSRIRKLIEPKPRLRYLSKQEIKVLLDSCESHHLRDAIELSILTGGRKNEVWKLPWKDVDWSLNQLTFKDTKSGKPRSIPMNNTIRGILSRRRKEIGLQSSFVFPRINGEVFGDKPTSFEKRWRVAKEIAGLNKPHEDGKVVWHTLRHTFASWAVMSGSSLTTVGELMGHEDEGQTQKYAHLAVPHLEGAMELLEKEFSSKQMVNKPAIFSELADYKEEKSTF